MSAGGLRGVLFNCTLKRDEGKSHARSLLHSVAGIVEKNGSRWSTSIWRAPASSPASGSI